MRRAALLVTATVVAVVGVGCSSDGNDDGSADTSEAVVSVDTSAASSTPNTEPSSTTADTASAPADSTAATAPPTTAAPVPATTIGPLVDPVVGLVEVGSFDRPVDVVVRPSDGRAFVVEQTGSIVAIDDESIDVVLDVSDLITNEGNEQGLLGLAFHPTLDLAYVDFTDTSGNTVVAEYAVDPESGTFDTGSYREVLTVDQPAGNHNGGKLVFGPDQLLYIGLGDGGAADDPDRNGLDLSTRLGKILRIDPAATDGEPFGVPTDNPFVGTEGADPTIWAYGLRNPWRFTFDRATGDLWIADVGQNEYEEIDHAPATGGVDAGKGLNFGWSALEGNERFNRDQPADGATPPVYVYSHNAGGCSVSGGAVAPAEAVGGLAGWYVFGDFCTGEIWALDPSSTADAPRILTIAELPGLAAIALGAGGDLYAISNAGTVARFAPA